MDLDLKGKTAVVSGSTAGIGLPSPPRWPPRASSAVSS